MKSCLVVVVLITICNLAIAYDSNFAFAQVNNPSTGTTRKFCVNHQPGEELPTSAEKATPVKLAWLTPDVKNANICAADPTHFEQNVVVPLKYVTYSVEDSRCLPKPLNTSNYMNKQAIWLQKFNVNKVLYLVEKGTPVEVTPGYHKYLFSQFYNPELTQKKPDTYYIYWNTFFDEFVSESAQTQFTDLEISFYRPKSFAFDGSEVIIMCIAVFCIVAGSLWSLRIMTEEDIKAARVLSVDRDSTAEEGSLREESPRPLSDAAVDSEKHDETHMTMTQQVVVVGVTVVMIFAILIMAFFFREVAVWFFNIFVALIGTYSIYKCLMVLYCFEESKKLSLSMVCCNLLNYSCLKKKFGFFNVFAVVAAAAVCVTWFIVRKEYYAFWLLNFINICLCVCAIHSCQIRNLKVVTMLLIGMFVYDIFMVFGTKLITANGCSVMLQVVTGVDCNAKPGDGPTYPIAPLEMNRPERMPLLFYVPLVNDAMQQCYDVVTETEYRHIMLGLGDVIVPGYLVVFCFFVDKLKATKVPYGVISVIGYVLGLVATFLALRFMQTAQPALIYLVPFTLIPISVASLVQGHFKELWHGKFKVDK